MLATKRHKPLSMVKIISDLLGTGDAISFEEGR